jgi:ubiquinol-cytochrome c reductase cytochrome c subunit
MMNSKCYLNFGLFLLLMALGLSDASAQVTASVNPVDDEAEALGRRTFVENCLICHGEDMTTNQRLTSKQWTAEIDKMIGWGSPVPTEKKPELLQYLTGSFSEKRTRSKLVTVPPPMKSARRDSSVLKGDLERGKGLFTKHCATCHGAKGQGGDLGTNLTEREILIEEDVYHSAVRKGVRRMPAFGQVLKTSDETDLLAWLRSLRGS